MKVGREGRTPGAGGGNLNWKGPGTVKNKKTGNIIFIGKY
jgi:hypothetical protein